MAAADEEVLSLQDARFPLSIATPRTTDALHWYAIHTRAKHEKRVATELREKGVETFVPVSREVHRWSDRNRVLDVPLFPCYAFVSVAINPKVQAAVSQHPSVLRWVGFQGRPSPIPEEEILAIRVLLRSGVPVGPHAFVKFGERVRIRSGSLDGVQGVLVGNDGDRKLVISIDLLGQSVAIALHDYELERAA
jgi:transcription antitermination factor NusG